MLPKKDFQKLILLIIILPVEKNDQYEQVKLV
jgi:hypothetical protein